MRVGGGLILGGCALFVVAVAIGVSGGTVFVGGGTAGSLAVTASLVFWGVGAAVLSLAGSGRLGRRATRLGLGIITLGLLTTVASGIVAAGSTVDPLENLPLLVVSGSGWMAILIGLVVTGVGLARSGSSSGGV